MQKEHQPPRAVGIMCRRVHTQGSRPTSAPHSLPTYTSPSKQLEKKRKREKKGKETSEKGEIAPKELKPQKGAKVAKGAQRKNMPKSSGAEMVADHRPKVPIWNPVLKLDEAPLPLDSSIKDFQKGKAGSVSDALEQPLPLP